MRYLLNETNESLEWNQGDAANYIAPRRNLAIIRRLFRMILCIDTDDNWRTWAKAIQRTRLNSALHDIDSIYLSEAPVNFLPQL
jgi:hypothetical protein